MGQKQNLFCSLSAEDEVTGWWWEIPACSYPQRPGGAAPCRAAPHGWVPAAAGGTPAPRGTWHGTSQWHQTPHPLVTAKRTWGEASTEAVSPMPSKPRGVFIIFHSLHVFCIFPYSAFREQDQCERTHAPPLQNSRDEQTESKKHWIPPRPWNQKEHAIIVYQAKPESLKYIKCFI